MNISKKRIGLFLLAAVATAVAMTIAERVGADDPEVDVEAAFEPAAVRSGEATVLTVRAGIPEGYHLYSMTLVPEGPKRLMIKPPKDAPLEPLGEWHAPKPAVEFDKEFKKNVEYYADKVAFQRAFKLTGEPAGGAVEIGFKGQICNPKQCIIISEKRNVALALAPGDARPDRTSAPKLEGEEFPPDRPAPTGGENMFMGSDPPTDEGFLVFLLIAFAAGVGALFTPCVFPMIPITVSFFSKYSKVSLRRSLTMALIYALSIMITFTLVGVIVSAVFGAVGMQWLAASGGFNIFMTALLVFFAFNLFGLFEIRVPSGLIGRASQKEAELTSDDGSLPRQAVGVFIMGFVFTLVSFTCTVGFIGFVIAQAAEGEWFYPTVGMLAFSFAFALPFFFLAVFPSWADKLKGKGGDWMVAVKATLGFLELAGAIKFLSNVDLVWEWGFLTRPLALTLWVGIFLTAGLFLLRVFNLPHSDTTTKHVGPIRMFFAILVLALAGYSFTGIRDTKSMGGWLDGWLPPAVYPGQEAAAASGEGEHLPWIVDDIEKGMAKAREANKPLFVDFTGYTCTNCRYMEGSVFPRPEVRSRLEKMILVTAYTDGSDEVHDKQREYQVERFKTAALPFYAILNPHDDTVLAVHPDMTKDVPAYVAFLDSGLEKFEQVKPKDAQATESDTDGAQQGEADAGAEHGGDTAEEEKIPTDIATEGAPVDFEFPELKGNAKIKLSSHRGKWVFVNFWASWCVPCRKELKNDFPPALASAPHITLLTVAFDGEDTEDAAIEFANDVKLWDHIVLQGGEDIEEAGLDEKFEVTSSLPLSYLIHPKGHISWMRKGSVHKELLIELFGKAKPVE
jgi:thiol:disulfide interchange protein DsbD